MTRSSSGGKSIGNKGTRNEEEKDQQDEQQQHKEGNEKEQVNTVDDEIPMKQEPTIPDIAAGGKTASSSESQQLMSPFAKYHHGHGKPNSPSKKSSKLSLTPARKVSLVVRVLVTSTQSPSGAVNMNNKDKKGDAAGAGAGAGATAQHPCVFPMDSYTPPALIASSVSSSSSTMAAPTMSNADTGLVVVNPSAMGKQVPTEITMETAKLVAQVAHLESEDWLRRFDLLDRVSWVKPEDDNSGAAEDWIVETAQAIASDVIQEHQQYSQPSSRIIPLPQHRVVLSIGEGTRRATHAVDKLLQRVVVTVGAAASAETAASPKLTISVLELVHDDELVDRLATSASTKPTAKAAPLRIRHLDNMGAIVQNLIEYPIDTLEDLQSILQRARKPTGSTTSRQAKHAGAGTSTPSKMEGHLLITLKVWKDERDDDADFGETGDPYTMIQFVQLASSEDFRTGGGGGGESDNNKKKRKSTASTSSTDSKEGRRHVASVRKSLSALRGILRGLIVQEQQTQHHPISFRESALTKLLQRSLEPSSSRVILMGTVLDSSDHYERTLYTLQYMHRLFVRPGQTAESPYTVAPASSSGVSTASSHQHVSAPISGETWLANMVAQKPDFLASVVSDPRQRLARAFPRSSPKMGNRKPGAAKSFKSAEHQHEDDTTTAYEETNYMDVDPTDFFPKGYGSVSSDKKSRASLLSAGSPRVTPTTPSSANPRSAGPPRTDPPYPYKGSSPKAPPSKTITPPPQKQRRDGKPHHSPIHPASSGAKKTPSLKSPAPNRSLDFSVSDSLLVDDHDMDTMTPRDDLVPIEPTPSAVPRSTSTSKPNLWIDPTAPPATSKAHKNPTAEPKPSAAGSVRGSGFSTSPRPSPSYLLSNNFMEDVVEIQGAVDQMRNHNMDGWQNGASSLERIQQYLFIQQALVQKTMAEKQQAEEAAAQLEKDLNRTRDESEKRNEETIKELKKQLAEAGSTQDSMEKVAEEAVLANERLDDQLRQLKGQLARTKQEADLRYEDYKRLLESKEKLYEDLKEARGKTKGLTLEQGDAAAKIADLEASVERLEMERDRLNSAKVRQRAEIEGLLRQSTSATAGMEEELDKARAELTEMKNLYDDLQQNMEELQRRAAADITSRDEELEQLRSQLEMTDEDLASTRERLQDEQQEWALSHVEFSKQQSDTEEKIQELERQKARLESERDAERNEKQAESARRKDAEGRVEVSDREIQRLKREQLELANELANAKEDALADSHRKETTLGEIRHENKLLKADLESESRTAREAEHENEKLQKQAIIDQNRVDAAQRELERLRDALMDASKSKEDVALEAAKANSVIGSRDEEIQALKEDIEELTNQRKKEKQDKELMKEKLTQFKEDAKAQLISIANTKDDLVRKKEAEIREMIVNCARLEEDLERLRKDSEGETGSLQEKIRKLQTEKGDTELLLVQLETELRDKTASVEDLAHKLQLAEIRANDKLLEKAREECRSLKGTNSRLSEELSDLKREVGSTKAAADAAQARAETLERQRLDAETAASGLKSQYEQSKLNIEELERQLALALDRTKDDNLLKKVREDNRYYHKLNSEISEENERLKLSEEELARALTEAEGVNEELKASMTDQAVLESALRERDLTIEDLQHQLELAKVRASDDLVRKARDENRALHTSNTMLGDEMGSMKREMEALRASVDTLKAKNNTLQDAKSRIDLEAAKLRSEIEQSKLVIEDLQHELKVNGKNESSDELRRAREDHQRYQHKATELASENEQLLREKEGLLRALAAAEEDVAAFRSKSRSVDGQGGMARLESELKERDMSIKDLKHRLELAEIRANDDLLKKVRDENRSLQFSNARLSEEVEMVKQELESTSNDVMVRIETLQRDKSETEMEVTRAYAQLEQSQLEIDNLRHELELASTRVNNDLLRKAREESRQQRKENSDLELANKKLEMEREDLSQALAAFKVQFDNLRKEVNSPEAQASIVKLETELKEREVTIEDLQHKLELAEIRANEQLLRKTRDENRSLVESNGKLSEELRAAKRELESSNSALTSIEGRVAKLSEEKSSAVASAEELRVKFERSEIEAEALKDELVSTSAKKDSDAREKQVAIAQLSESNKQLSREKDHLSSSLVLVQKEVESLRLEVKRTRSDVEFARLESQVREQDMTIEDLKHQLEIATIRVNDDLWKKAREENRALVASNAQISEEVNRFKRELEVMKSNMESSEELIERLKVQKNEAETNAARIQAEYQKSQVEVDSLSRNLSAVGARESDELARVRNEVRQHQEEKDKLLQAVSKLQEEQKDLTRELTVAKEKAEDLLGSHEHNESMALQRLGHENQNLRYRLERASQTTSAGQVEERSRRERAEELLAIMSARAKTSLDTQRDEIMKLRVRLAQVSEEKEAEIRTLRNRLQDWERGEQADGDGQERSFSRY